MDSEKLREVYASQAIKYDKSSDKAIWISALFCSRVVGKYTIGATLGLADDMNRSTDTVEDRSHGYSLFEKLCKLDDGLHRKFIFNARRAPFIHFSHFRALYDLQNTYELSDGQILSLLLDIVQAEGGLSSRKLDEHVRTRFGDTRDWHFYAQRVMKEVNKTLQEPTLPKEEKEKLTEIYNYLGDRA